VARNEFRRRRGALPNVLLLGGVVGVLVVSFLLILSLIRSYVEPPRIPPARPMLASAEPTAIGSTGLTEPFVSVLDLARANAMENLAAVMVRGESPLPAVAAAAAPAAAEESSPAGPAIPLPPRRPREMLISLTGDVPIPRPRPQE
jgi:hypothetical protein